MVVLKGYDGDREVWAIAKTYGSGETAENFICLVDPNNEIKREFEKSKNAFHKNNIKKGVLKYVGKIKNGVGI